MIRNFNYCKSSRYTLCIFFSTVEVQLILDVFEHPCPLFVRVMNEHGLGGVGWGLNAQLDGFNRTLAALLDTLAAQKPSLHQRSKPVIEKVMGNASSRAITLFTLVFSYY